VQADLERGGGGGANALEGWRRSTDHGCDLPSEGDGVLAHRP
jgi:hypothetical protein